MLRLKNNIINVKNPNTGQFESVPTMMGESIYQIAVRNGYEGTEEEWLEEVYKTWGGGGTLPPNIEVSYDSSNECLAII